MAERELNACFRIPNIPTTQNSQAHLASRNGCICSAPKFMFDRALLQTCLKHVIAAVLCCDVTGHSTKYSAGSDEILFFSVVKNWFDTPTSICN